MDDQFSASCASEVLWYMQLSCSKFFDLRSTWLSWLTFQITNPTHNLTQFTTYRKSLQLWNLMGILDIFLASSVVSMDMKYVPKLNRTEVKNLTLFYNFHFLHFSIGRVLTIANPSGKKFKVYMKSKVRYFGGAMIKVHRWSGVVQPAAAFYSLFALQAFWNSTLSCSMVAKIINCWRRHQHHIAWEQVNLPNGRSCTMYATCG